MRVIFILANHSTAPYFNWFAERSNGDKDLEFSFVNLSPTKPQMIEDVGVWGCNCYWIPYDCSSRKSEMIKATIKLYALLKKLKPDVVHCHLFDDSVMGLLAARLARVKTRVITKGDAGFHYYFKPKWVLMDKFNNANATNIIAISEENREFILNKEKANPLKVSRIHHGIPYKIATAKTEDLINFYKAKFSLENKIVIGTVSRFIEWKGYIHIINAVEKIILNYPMCKFLFIGSGNQKEELKRLVKEKGLEEYIVFSDFIPPNHIPSIYGVMDIYLHAAVCEPFGLVIAEAMLNKLALVSTNTGAARDSIIHKKNGYLVEYRDIDKLNEGVIYMLENNRKEIGKEAFVTAMEKFEFQIMYDNHKKLYFFKDKIGG